MKWQTAAALTVALNSSILIIFIFNEFKDNQYQNLAFKAPLSKLLCNFNYK